MKSQANDLLIKTDDKPQNDEPVDGNDAIADQIMFDAIFGEPSNEEIAAALRQAEADFQAGKYQPARKASDISKEDDEPWHPQTKKEILEGIRLGFMNVLAGDYQPIEGLSDTLGSALALCLPPSVPPLQWGDEHCLARMSLWRAYKSIGATMKYLKLC